MGGDHGPAEVVPGALDYAARPPGGPCPPRRRPATASARRSPACPSNVEIVPASQVIEMDEHPALALREKKDASILVGCDLVRNGKADAIVTAGHTGRRHGRRRAAARATARRRPSRARRPDGPPREPVRAPRHRRQPGLDRREPRPVRADGRDLRGEGRRHPEPARRAPLDRRGEGQGRPAHPARDRAARRARTCGSSATSRARTSSPTWPMWWSPTRCAATS